MATLDAARASYVQTDYRLIEKKDQAVRSSNTNAITFEKPTQLSQSAAQAIADTIFEIVRVRTGVYQVIWHDILRLSQLDGGVPTFRLYDDRLGLNGLLTRLESFEPDFRANKTTLTVVG
ncbi:hypothetical protein SAMN05518849_11688 [Sphingobium sp. AP50]|uniref:hypothetical protein n=1 Tax=Sphingobium sp. AP50 TaxID=1884369 RepID=UPI0008B4EFEB|nr:hypothetical protein [Sphingobium sp. AP50]SEJ87602.1 hypothetical protein SAMN05518849_11688 [Sphingobium sp. AP50]